MVKSLTDFFDSAPADPLAGLGREVGGIFSRIRLLPVSRILKIHEFRISTTANEFYVIYFFKLVKY